MKRARKNAIDYDAIAAEVYQQLGVQPARALRLAEKAIAIAKRERANNFLPKMTLCRAHALRECGRQTEALKEYEKAARLYRQNGEFVDAWRTVIGKIDALDQLGKYEAAIREAKAAARFFRNSKLPVWEAKIYANAGNVYQHLDRYSQALRNYQRAYEVLSREHPVDAHIALFNQANLHLLTGNPEAALRMLENCRQFFESENLLHYAASAQYNLAYGFYLLGKYQNALEHISRAREDFQKLNDKPFLASCFLDEAELYARLNRGDDAIAMANKARKQFRALNMPYELAEANSLLGISMLKRGEMRAGLRILKEAETFFRKQNNEIKCAELDSHIALHFVKQNHPHEAQKYLRRAYTIFSKHKLYPRMLSCVIYMAGLRSRTGDWRAAERLLKEAAKWIGRVTLPWVLIPYYQLLGKSQAKLNYKSEAIANLNRAIRAVENIRSEIPAEDLRISFFHDKLDAFHAMIQLGLAEQTAWGAKHAFLYAERARSRVLQDLLEGTIVFRQEHQQMNSMFHTDSWRRSVEHASGISSRRHAQAATLVRKNQMSLLREKQAQLSTRQIQAAIASNQCVISYYATENDLHAFVVDREMITAHPSIARLSDLRDRWQLLRFQMERGRIDSSASAEECYGHLHFFGDALIAPLLKRLQQHRIWTVIPFGWLHELPFHCLRNDRSYFSERYLFSYTPSATVYNHCVRRKRHGENVLLIGYSDELAPWIDTEVTQIRSIYPNAFAVVGEQARSQVLMDHARNARIIHIASHGRFQKNAPLFSGILLRDGWLTIPQIYHLRMNAELVTLSGCETGTHEISAGEELLGLMRAFLYAGASSLLASLWRVSDPSTAFFMKEFYSALSAGRNKVDAWQIALLHTKEKWPHPFYWGPFVLIGNPY